MERWAANTLRTLGIILIAGFILLTSLFLLLLSLCAYGGGIGGGTKRPDQALAYLVAAVLVIVFGVWGITFLARRIIHSSAGGALSPSLLPSAVGLSSATPALGAEPQLQIPLHLSSAGRRAVEHLVVAMGAQILVSSGIWLLNQVRFWSARPGMGRHNWVLLFIAPFVLSHLPYGILIYALLKKPDRRAFSYALAVPAILILETLFSLSLISYYYLHQPTGLLLLFVPWGIHIVILVLAYRAIQQVGIHPEPSSLIVAALVSFLYFSLIHVLTPFLYRFFRWP